jgi:glycerol-3-phosphate O-acyltransferase/dihydroxyacetone phosphate acyltransferase
VTFVAFSEALAASSVKVAGRDVLATWKVLVSLGLTPVIYLLYSILAYVAAARFGPATKYKLWAPFVTMAAMPFFAYSALKFGEAGLDVFKSVLKLILANSRGSYIRL